MRIGVSALVASLICVPVTASAEQLSWIGPGAASCSQYAQAVRISGENMRSFFFSWAQGFLSGVNTHPMLAGSSTNLAALAANSQQTLIDQFCDQHPLALYVNAVLSLYDSMRSEQGLHDWRPTPKY
jgi:hypothetical protein